MIKTIYLDMDGVIVDFLKGAKEYNVIKENGKIDWRTLESIGSSFWENLDWLDGSKEFYKWLLTFCERNNLDLCILTAIHLDEGKRGKMKWLSKNCPEIQNKNIYIVQNGSKKKKHATESSLLIDDFGKNVEEFIIAGGHAIKFTSPKNAKESLNGIIL